jgi:hypothetical protein
MSKVTHHQYENSAQIVEFPKSPENNVATPEKQTIKHAKDTLLLPLKTCHC